MTWWHCARHSVIALGRNLFRSAQDTSLFLSLCLSVSFFLSNNNRRTIAIRSTMCARYGTIKSHLRWFVFSNVTWPNWKQMSDHMLQREESIDCLLRIYSLHKTCFWLMYTWRVLTVFLFMASEFAIAGIWLWHFTMKIKTDHEYGCLCDSHRDYTQERKNVHVNL